MSMSIIIRNCTLLSLFLLLIFSCSSDEDKRKSVRSYWGEPDFIETSEYGTMDSQYYIYARSDINSVYEFRRASPGCGGSGEWYVYQVWYADYLGYELYMPPAVTHTPVVSAPVAQDLQLSAVITDGLNTDVDSVRVYYRTVGQKTFTSANMTQQETPVNTYIVTIPGASMISAGIDYYIEIKYIFVTYEKEYTMQVPEVGYYTITISPTSKVIVASPPGPVIEYKKQVQIPERNNSSFRLSPISP